MSQAAVLDRVRKLLALATSPNVNEAAAAAARAQDLITRHRLQSWLDAEATAAADPDPIVDARDTPLEVARRCRTWKVALAAALADANGCVVYTLDLGHEEAIVLIGRQRDRDAVRALWEPLVHQVAWLSATHGAGRPRRWHEDFRIGAVDAIAARLTEAEATARGDVPEAALVRLDPARQAHAIALERFVAERLGPGRGRPVRVDPRAWRAGRAASEALTVPKRGT